MEEPTRMEELSVAVAMRQSLPADDESASLDDPPPVGRVADRAVEGAGHNDNSVSNRRSRRSSGVDLSGSFWATAAM